MDKIVLVLSDIEVGDGSLTDDFIDDDAFCSFISSYLIHRYDHIPIEIVFNGDTFDFIKTGHNNLYPRYITDDISLKKLDLFAKAHPKFFAAVKKFLKKKKNSVIFICGNHDPDIMFNSVQKTLKKMLPGKVAFSGFYYKQGSVRIEHGSQLDLIFKVGKHSVITYNNKKILNLPFVTYIIFEHLMPIKKQYPLFERVSPKKLFLSKLKNLSRRFTVLNTKYFFKSLVKVIKNKEDPTYRLAGSYVRKMLMRMVNNHYDVAFDKMVRKFIKKTKGTEILIIGHSHKAREERIKDKFIINTGTWRDEYILSKYDNVIRAKSKHFAEVIITKNKIISARLIRYKSANKSIDINVFGHFQ